MNNKVWNRKELKSAGKTNFTVNYWKCVLISLISTLLIGGASFSGANSSSLKELSDTDIGTFIAEIPSEIWAILFGVVCFVGIISWAIKICVLNPLSLGCTKFYTENHKSPAALGNLGYAFSRNYPKVILTLFLRELFTALWTCLLIVPGVIKHYEYRMIPYLLADNPEMTSKEAFAESKRMMNGQKWNAFVLDLSFIGWQLLSGLTAGILGIFYVNPYVDATCAELYYALKDEPAAADGSFYEDAAYTDLTQSV